MSPDPKLPRFTETSSWLQAFITRFYRLWSELFSAISELTPVYSEWTPVLSFATPGTPTIAYSLQTGRCYKVGKRVFAEFTISTSTFTPTGASGNLQITGLPYLPVSDAANGVMQWQGITNASYTQWNPYVVAGSSTINVVGSASAQNNRTLQASDMPSGGTVTLIGTVAFQI